MAHPAEGKLPSIMRKKKLKALEEISFDDNRQPRSCLQITSAVNMVIDVEGGGIDRYLSALWQPVCELSFKEELITELAYPMDYWLQRGQRKCHLMT